MLSPPAPHNANGFLIFDLGITLIGIALGYAWPTIGLRLFRTIERTFISLARKKGLSVIVVGLSVILFRLAILPIHPIPRPFAPDDFSFLLAANTFASGRLANPTPAMWHSFETLHVTMNPTYMSMYFPGQGLLLAAGTLFLGNPWFAVLIVTSLMCAAICWMLQAWLPPNWALLGGLIAVLHLGLFTYWVNSFTGAAQLAAIGGALVLGALPRFLRHPRFRHSLIMGIGMVLMAYSRPYEGVLLCLPVCVVLIRWIFKGKNRLTGWALMRCATPPLVLVVAAGAWMGYYDYRAFGKATALPYTVNRAQYAVAPYYVWQDQRPDPGYRHNELRAFYYDNELPFYTKIHKPSGFIPYTFLKFMQTLMFYAGFALIPPLIMIRRVFLDRRIRFLIIGMIVLAAGMVIEIFLIPHYLAPFTCAFFAIGLQCLRHLRLWRPGGKPVGLGMVRMLLSVCVLMAGIRLYSEQLHFLIHQYPPGDWTVNWYGPAAHFGEPRANILAQLDKIPGKHLVIVRYSTRHETLNEWVYNWADIDNSKVVWAQEMDAAHNQELMQYYKDRQVWLVEPDLKTVTLEPYPQPAVGAPR